MSYRNILSELSEKGFSKIEKCASQSTLSSLSSDFIKIFQNPTMECCHFLELEVGAACSVKFDKSKHQSIPHTQAFFNQKWMQQLSDSFWHKQIPINTEIYVMHELPGTQHNAQDLHFDVKKTLKFFLYLNDVTEANGAFSCVPGSHNESEKIRNKYGNEISYENRHLTRQLAYNNEQVISVEGNAGDLILFNTDVWHRAGIVKEGERKVMRGHTRPGM